MLLQCFDWGGRGDSFHHNDLPLLDLLTLSTLSVVSLIKESEIEGRAPVINLLVKGKRSGR